MPEATRSSRAYEALTAARKALQTTKADATGINQKADFDIKKLGQEGAYKQDFYGYAQDTLTIAQSGAALYEDWATFEEGKEEVAKKVYEKERQESKEEAEADPNVTATAHSLREWDELMEDEQEQYMPQKEYDFDTDSMWGKIRKPLEDLSQFLGDVDPKYTIQGKPFKASSIKAIGELKEVEDLKELFGIQTGTTSYRQSIPDPSSPKSSKYLGTYEQRQKLLEKLGGKKGGSLGNFLIKKGMPWDPKSVKKLWDEQTW